MPVRITQRLERRFAGVRAIRDWQCGQVRLAHFGARALNSLRLEKSFGNWAREYRPLYTPGEAGLDRFVNIAKPDFVGRDAVRRDRASGSARRLVTFVVDAADADAIGDEPVW